MMLQISVKLPSSTNIEQDYSGVVSQFEISIREPSRVVPGGSRVDLTKTRTINRAIARTIDAGELVPLKIAVLRGIDNSPFPQKLVSIITFGLKYSSSLIAL